LLEARRRGRSRRAQQALPVVGYLNLGGSPESDASRLTGLRRGLNQTGYVEGRNVVIEYRWAGNQVDRLPVLVADLVQLPVSVIVAVGVPAALAAKAASTSVPIVFSVGADPVQFGLVSTLSRREFVMAGGLISYGTSMIENYRQVGLYAGRILKGEKPAGLPVIQATKIELNINLKTAKTLGLEVPAKLLALADEVIE
jgi:ABC-type uncharacterized transport system substrate-binding protein